MADSDPEFVEKVKAAMREAVKDGDFVGDLLNVEGSSIPMPPPPTAFSSGGFSSPPIDGADSGFRQAYPYGHAPLPSALLRPLKQPLYDTEVVPAGSSFNEIRFFQRHLGRDTMFGTECKGACMTNLSQPGQLANPLEYSIFGFGFRVSGLDAKEKEELLTKTNLMFLYTGNRIYLDIPLTLVPEIAQEDKTILFRPSMVKNDKDEDVLADWARQEAEAVDDMNVTVKLQEVKDLEKQNVRFLSFTVGKSCLRMRPTESFSLRLHCDHPLEFKTDFRMLAFIYGLQWTPL